MISCLYHDLVGQLHAIEMYTMHVLTELTLFGWFSGGKCRDYSKNDQSREKPPFRPIISC